MASIIRRVERNHSISAWVGDRERLDRIARLLQRLVEKGQAMAIDDDPVELVVTATESGSQTLRGEPDDVFVAMDRDALLKLELEVSRAHPVTKLDIVRIAFDKENGKGVKLETKGEASWIEEAFAGLVEEINRGRPSWAWLRGGGAGWLIALLAFAEVAQQTRRTEQESSDCEHTEHSDSQQFAATARRGPFVHWFL